MKWNNYYHQFAVKLPFETTAHWSILEIGVRHGDGLRYLRNRYPNAYLYGIDIQCTPECAVASVETKTRLTIGNQCFPNTYRNIPETLDVVIDDGGHRPYQQAASFKYLWPRLSNNGVYIIEDFHMNFRWHWRLYGMLFGIRPILSEIIAQQNRWTGGGEDICERSPVEISFTPQLVILTKGSITMRPE